MEMHILANYKYIYMTKVTLSHIKINLILTYFDVILSNYVSVCLDFPYSAYNNTFYSQKNSMDV